MSEQPAPAPAPVEPSPTSAVPARAHLPAENAARLETHTLRFPAGPRRNPADYSISLRTKFGTDQQLLRPGRPRQSMRGFEPHYTDIIDFIVRATHKVWEEKDIGYIYELYSHRTPVTDDYGLNWGRDPVIANTAQFINAFPDIRLIADEIIWAGDDEVGFYTSHRTVLKATHTGYSQFGPPTGRKLQFWLTANCVSVANEIVLEHVIYNTTSMLQQMGHDLRAKARELGNRRTQPGGLHDARSGEPARLPGQGKPAHLPPSSAAGFDVEDFLRRTLHYVWNWRLLGKMVDAYAPNVRFYGATDRAYYGVGELQSFVLSLIAAFPDLVFSVDDVYWMGNEAEGYTTSTRWSLVGTHTGPGVYGAPTGRRVYMWGITQHVIQQGRITEEWMTWNEFDVLQQIYRD
ncbi:MAG: ester cyclase [Anaerolineales bacterium]|nr:ester cyclase [Anaerolineales bacterium]